MHLDVLYDSFLLEYLLNNISGKSKNNIKSLLKTSVYVNDKMVTKFDFRLKKGDKVFIVLKRINDIDVLYEDDDLIIVNKPHDLLTVATLKEKEKTMYHMVLEYLKKKNQKVFVIHRLDRETSGVLMFAKNEKVKNNFQNNWDKQVLKRKYVAVLEGNITPSKSTLKSYLAENKNYLVYSTTKDKGKEAITKYETICYNKKYTLVDIEILTGRKNQIRVQFADIGFPIVGDKKYGHSNDRLYLHASSLTFKHPNKNKIMCVSSNIPDSFERLIGR